MNMNQVREILAEIGTAGKNADGSYTRSCYSPEYFQAAEIVHKRMEAMEKVLKNLVSLAVMEGLVSDDRI